MNDYVNQIISEDSVDGIIFDLGGVLVDIDFTRIFSVWASYAKTDIEHIKSLYNFDKYYEAHERGEINHLEYFSSLRKSLEIDITDEQFSDGWNSIFGEEIADITSILPKLSQKRPIFVLTNTNTIHQKVWEKKYTRLLSYFKQIFVSSDIGLRKPEPEIFKYVSENTGIDLKRFVFFDDMLENVTGAHSVGIRSIQVSSTTDITESLRDLLR
jgi:glucose-1-phosphatase